MGKKKYWRNVRLTKNDAEKLTIFLKENKIYYEPSADFDMIHFEILLNDAEVREIEAFLSEL